MDENLKIDLEQRLGRLDVAWSAMNGQQAQPPAGIATMALWWAQALADEGPADGRGAPFGGDDAAHQVSSYLVPEVERRSSAFWATDLGRAIARNGAAPVGPDGDVPGATLAAILGISRHRAFQIQTAGRGLTPSQVVDEMRTRNVPRG